MHRIVEDKIKEAIKNGEFDNLPGKGKPLNLKEDLQGLSPKIRRAYQILKNAGYIDDDMQKKKTELRTEDFIAAATGEKYHNEAENKQQFQAFVKRNNLHKNKSFHQYAKKMYNKLFQQRGP